MVNQQELFRTKKKWEIKKFSVEHMFGPPVAIIEMPAELTRGLILLTDKVLEKKNYPSHGDQLAGQIYHEPTLSLEMLDVVGAAHFFHNCATHYLNNVLSKKIRNFEKEYVLQIFFTSIWAVSQREGEYNPAHHHTDCDISSVCYLKIPNYKKRWGQDRRFKGESGDGDIEFIAKSVDNGLENGTYRHSPRVGDFFLFPSSLIHTVYPFLGDGERRSIAFNMGYQLRHKESGRVRSGRSDGVHQNSETGLVESLRQVKETERKS